MPKQLYQNRNGEQALNALYARLAGELKRIDRHVASLQSQVVELTAEREMRAQQMANVVASLKLLNPQADATVIAPKETHVRLAFLPNGALRQEILAVLKVSATPITAGALHREVIRRNALVFPDRVARAHHRRKLGEALHALAQMTPPRVEAMLQLVKGGYSGQEQLWRRGSLFND